MASPIQKSTPGSYGVDPFGRRSMRYTSMIERKYPFFYFTSVNQRVNPLLQRDEELLDSVNWYSYRIGQKKVRPGLTPFLDQIDNRPVTGMFYAKFPNGSKRLVRASGGKLYAVDPTVAVTWGSSIVSNGTDFVRPEATVLNGLMHIVSLNSSTEGHYYEYNGTTVTDTTYASGADAVIPNRGKTCVTYHRRVYVGSPYDGTNLFRSMLSWSSIDYQNKGTSPSSPWTTQAVLTDISYASNRQIDIDYRGKINKITNINDRINIYKEEGIYSYNETSMTDLFGVAAYDGSISTMQETKEDYFFTNEGFFKTDGTTTTPIAEGWYPIIKEILHNGIDTTKLVSGAVNYRYYSYLGQVTYGGRTLNHATFVYDAKLDEMWLWDFGFAVSSFSSYVDVNGEKIVLIGDQNGNVYKLDEYADTDAGVSIRASMRTKYYYFDDPSMFNWVSEMYGFSSPGSELEVSLDRDYLGQYETIGYITGAGTTLRVNQDRVGMFKQLSVEVTWNGKGKRPTFDGVIFNIKQNSEEMK